MTQSTASFLDQLELAATGHDVILEPVEEIIEAVEEIVKEEPQEPEVSLPDLVAEELANAAGGMMVLLKL